MRGSLELRMRGSFVVRDAANLRNARQTVRPSLRAARAVRRACCQAGILTKDMQTKNHCGNSTSDRSSAEEVESEGTRKHLRCLGQRAVVSCTKPSALSGLVCVLCMTRVRTSSHCPRRAAVFVSSAADGGFLVPASDASLRQSPAYSGAGVQDCFGDQQIRF